MPEQHIVTVPQKLAPGLRDAVLTAVEEVLEEAGARRIRVDTTVHRDVAVLADFGPESEN